MAGPVILCPVDFSRASRGALRYAFAIAEHFGARLALLTVNDPLLQEATELRLGGSWLEARTRRELVRFHEEATSGRRISLEVTTHVATGKPASEILTRAREEGADLIVMSSRGASSVRKLFFGATAERVLRETTIPVLVTPAQDPGPSDLDDLRRRLHHVLAPIDFSGAIDRQIGTARAIAEAFDTPLLLTHVVEPLAFARAVQPELGNLDNERRHRAEQSLREVAARWRSDREVELLTAFGDPAEEVAKIATDRGVGLIVMGLHASPRHGRRMGSVTYRVLCLAHTLVLALPPAEERDGIAPATEAGPIEATA
jgi:nucleotide-binding universal stress UspA family protein